MQKIENFVHLSRNYPGPDFPRKPPRTESGGAGGVTFLPHTAARQVLMAQMLLQNRFRWWEIEVVLLNRCKIRRSARRLRSNSGTFPPIVVEFAFPSLMPACII